MFSIDEFRNSIPIAIIRGKGAPLDGEVVYMKDTSKDDNEEIRERKGRKIRYEDEDPELEDIIEIDEGKMELLPTKIPNQRQCIFVAGRSGSGKSTFCRNYIKNFLRMFKNRPVYIFSALTEDPAFDDLNITRILLDMDLVENPIDVSELYESLVIMDDIDAIKDKQIQKAVYDLQDQILEIGRHHAINIINTSHKATAGHRTRNLLNESTHICIFPCRGSNITKYYLEKYSGLNKQAIQKIYSSPSRWTCMQIGFPGFILQEKSVWLPE